MSQKVAHEPKITAKQQAMIAALIAGNNHTTAASTIGVDRNTITKWLRLPHVQEAYKAAQKQVFDDSLSALMVATDSAIRTLKVIMLNAESPPAARVRAAQIILEQAIEQFKVSELEQKISELEQLIKDTGR